MLAIKSYVQHALYCARCCQYFIISLSNRNLICPAIQIILLIRDLSAEGNGQLVRSLLVAVLHISNNVFLLLLLFQSCMPFLYAHWDLKSVVLGGCLFTFILMEIYRNSSGSRDASFVQLEQQAVHGCANAFQKNFSSNKANATTSDRSWNWLVCYVNVPCNYLYSLCHFCRVGWFFIRLDDTAFAVGCSS